MIPGSGREGKIPWRRTWQPLQYSCMEEPHGQRSLAGCSPLGCEFSDTTKHTHTYIICIIFYISVYYNFFHSSLNTHLDILATMKNAAMNNGHYLPSLPLGGSLPAKFLRAAGFPLQSGDHISTLIRPGGSGGAP